MQAKSVIDAVDDLLQDAAGIRWPREQRLRWFNEGQLAIVSVRPDAKSITGNIVLVAGELQTLPAGGLRLLDVLRNVGGRGITLVSREVMTDLNANWFTGTAKSAVKHYCHDARLPKEFDVYPPVTAGVQISARYSVAPTDCDAETDQMDIDDTYKPALVNWICHRAYLREAETASQELASGYLAAFVQLLTGKASAEKSEEPSQSYPNRLRPNVQ